MNKMIQLFKSGINAYVKVVSDNQVIRLSANHSAFNSDKR